MDRINYLLIIVLFLSSCSIISKNNNKSKLINLDTIMINGVKMYCLMPEDLTSVLQEAVRNQ